MLLGAGLGVADARRCLSGSPLRLSSPRLDLPPAELARRVGTLQVALPPGAMRRVLRKTPSILLREPAAISQLLASIEEATGVPAARAALAATSLFGFEACGLAARVRPQRLGAGHS